jgi:hypothetical protein
MGSVSHAEHGIVEPLAPYDRIMVESGPSLDGAPDDHDMMPGSEMPDADADESRRELQSELYGEPLAELFARLRATYRISDSRLAAVIGISTPMLAQLTTGERTKISNPAVHGRLQRLDELARAPEVQAGDPARLLATLNEVAVATPLRTTRERVGGLSSSRDTAADYLGDIAIGTDLQHAAAAVPATDLAALLLEAARRLR